MTASKLSVLRMVILVIKHGVLLGLMLFLFGVFYVSIEDLNVLYETFAKNYYLNNGFEDTYARNLVTAIYLDYRLFDSIFEAGILLIAVSGIMWISKHDIEKHNVHFMLDKFKTPDLFVMFARIVYPLMLVFGFYVVVNGHISPGGGFQGGAIIATAILILYYIDPNKETDSTFIVSIEKGVFLLIIAFAMVSIFTKGTMFTNPFTSTNADVQSIYLIVMNVLIGVKVALGLWTIFTAFLREGR